MPITKVFEIRDSMTDMVIYVTQLGLNYNEKERSLQWKAGFGETEPEQQSYHVMFVPSDKEGSYDLYHWYDDRTLFCAFRFAKSFFNQLNHGEMIDVEFLLGETEVSKVGDASQEWMKGALLAFPETARFSRKRTESSSSEV